MSGGFSCRGSFIACCRGLFSRVSHPCVPLMKLASFCLTSSRSLRETEVRGLYAPWQIAGLIAQILLLQIFFLQKVRI